MGKGLMKTIYHAPHLSSDDAIWHCDCRRSSERWHWSWSPKCRRCGVEQAADRVAPSSEAAA